MVRSLYDCPEVTVGPEGLRYRVVVATHSATKKKSPVGVTRAGVVYELFVTDLPQQGFTTSDVVEIYLHRGAFEPALSDEDQELDPDRWCSHSAWGQECWQIISQWVPEPEAGTGASVRANASAHGLSFAPAISLSKRPATSIASPTPTPASGYGPPATATRLGKRAASPALTSLSSPTEPESRQQAMRFTARSGVEKLTGACAWCMRPVSVTAALAHCAHSVNGRATRRASHAR